jgi:AraC-like DNA-binding protein
LSEFCRAFKSQFKISPSAFVEHFWSVREQYANRGRTPPPLS